MTMIKNHVVSFPAQTAGNIVENLKAEASTDALMVDDDIINFANGTFNISNCRWTYEKFFCRNRLRGGLYRTSTGEGSRALGEVRERASRP